MIVYLDTSSLVKLYVEEAGSAIVRDVTQKASVIATSKIAYAEARAAFARKQRDDGFSITALKIVEDLNRDWESYFIIEVTDGIIRSAGDIAEKYLLRGFDSIHLASAVSLKGKIGGRSVFFKRRRQTSNRAAGKEGIKVL